MGSSGGFRIGTALALGATRVDSLEPDPVLNRALRRGLAGSPAFRPDPRVRISTRSPLAALNAGGH